MIIKFKRCVPDARLPERQTAMSSGLDLYVSPDFRTILWPGQRRAIPTGVSMELASGFEGQVRSRSGLAAKDGIVVLNSPGTIDADYRGEIQVILMNHGDQPFTITGGTRIAQLVIAPVTMVEVQEAVELTSTARGEGGLGSTGVR